jgi:hypothetical protein
MADAIPGPPAYLPNVVDWKVFLTDYPPGTRGSVDGAVEEVGTDGRPKISVPELQLECDGTCQGMSYCGGVIRGVGELFPGPGRQQAWDAVLYYCCRKCRAPVKSYAVRVEGDDSVLRTVPTPTAAKLAEWPPFCFRTPSKVNSLIGPDRAFFFKGRKAESDGLGVGAFAYYRRIVEDQKNRLLDEIIRVARRTNARPETISRLEAAKAESQFSKAVDMVKDAVPQSLLIKGHNPLTLLHSALSRNLHRASDAECLQVARDIRVILFELADRLGQALKDERELNDALARLLTADS